MGAYHAGQWGRALQKVRSATSLSDFAAPECIIADAIVDPDDENQCRIDLVWIESRDTVSGVAIIDRDGAVLADGRLATQKFDSTFMPDIGQTLCATGAARFPLRPEGEGRVPVPTEPGNASLPTINVHQAVRFSTDLSVSLTKGDGARTGPFQMFVAPSLAGREADGE